MSIIINEDLKFKNKIRCKLLNINTNELQVCEQPNTVVITGKQLLLDLLGLGGSIQLKHAAVGGCSGLTSNNSLILTSEIARNTVVYDRMGQIGTYSIFFNISEVNKNITEVGYFGGSSSYTSINTGIMFNRILLSSPILKTSNHTLTIDLDIGFTQ